MKTLANFIVDKRKFLLAFFIVLAAVSAVLVFRVEINYDMSQYLPADSSNRIGMDIMAREFLESHSTNLYVMLTGLDASQKENVRHTLQGIPNVSAVAFEPYSERHNRDEHALFIVTIPFEARGAEVSGAASEIERLLAHYEMDMAGVHDGFDMVALLIPALIVLVIVMFAMADSWIDPIVMLINIGIAVVINMGTNFIFENVSDLTFAVAPVLQLVLSLSYSIMLINRYRQEKERGADKKEAMRGAVTNSLLPISSSSLTTALAMLTMLFLSFTIGTDMGLVLAKGVVISLLCVFGVMPALILMLDSVMEKTRKRALHPNMSVIAGFCYRVRYAILVFFIAAFAGGFFLAQNAEVSFNFVVGNGVFRVFPPDNPIIVVYENFDEGNMAPLIAQWEYEWRNHPSVQELTAHSTLMKAAAVGMAMAAEMPPEMLQEAMREMENALAHVAGANYSRLIIATVFPEESDETVAFLDNIMADLENNLHGSFYLVGNSAMKMELAETFPAEQAFVTVLSVAAMILMIGIFFRRIAPPLIIVSTVQAGIFISTGTIFFQGSSIMFLALIIVQCILIGAATDYGILFASYYKEARKTQAKKEAMAAALTNSTPTFFTSGAILIFVTLIVGITFHDPVVSEILMFVSRGGIVTMIIVIFILPPLMTVFDKFVTQG